MNKYYVLWEVSYKNLSMLALANDEEKRNKLLVRKEGEVVEEFRRSKWFDEEDGREYLQEVYTHYLYEDIIEILKNDATIEVKMDSKRNPQIIINYISLNLNDYQKVKEGLEL